MTAHRCAPKERGGADARECPILSLFPHSSLVRLPSKREKKGENVWFDPKNYIFSLANRETPDCC